MTISLTPHMTRAEQQELARLENTIKSGLQQFLEVGTALLTIRQRRLYRDAHESFESYCREKWGFSKTHANRLIAGAEAVIILGDIEVRPTNEAQARHLTTLPPDQIRPTWQRVVEESGGKPTMEDVRRAVDEALQKPVPQPRDKTFARARLMMEFHQWAVGRKIPAKIISQVEGWLRLNLR